MRILYAAGFLAIGFFSLSSSASIPRDVPQIEKILAEKTPEKFAQLKKLGPQVYKDLRNLAFNEKRTLGIRWEAFMAMVRIGEKESLPEVDQALQRPDWFMRDAALRVLPVLDESRAYKAAVTKLSDSALVVRTAAVDVLGHLGKPDCSDLLWKQLYSKDNYIHHESLWIRRHIVETLSKVAPPGSEAKFVKVLDDADSTLFDPAIHGLERLTHKKLGADNVPPVYRRYFWKKWFAENHH